MKSTKKDTDERKEQSKLVGLVCIFILSACLHCLLALFCVSHSYVSVLIIPHHRFKHSHLSAS
jgi:hypothetical protein